MSEQKILLNELQSYVRDARRYYAAGQIDRAKEQLRAFKRRVEKAFTQQQVAMVRELRNATLEAAKEARDLSLQIKNEQSPS